MNSYRNLVRNAERTVNCEWPALTGTSCTQGSEEGAERLQASEDWDVCHRSLLFMTKEAKPVKYQQLGYISKIYIMISYVFFSVCNWLHQYQIFFYLEGRNCTVLLSFHWLFFSQCSKVPCPILFICVCRANAVCDSYSLPFPFQWLALQGGPRWKAS